MGTGKGQAKRVKAAITTDPISKGFTQEDFRPMNDPDLNALAAAWDTNEFRATHDRVFAAAWESYCYNTRITNLSLAEHYLGAINAYDDTPRADNEISFVMTEILHDVWQNEIINSLINSTPRYGQNNLDLNNYVNFSDYEINYNSFPNVPEFFSLISLKKISSNQVSKLLKVETSNEKVQNNKFLIDNISNPRSELNKMMQNIFFMMASRGVPEQVIIQDDNYPNITSFDKLRVDRLLAGKTANPSAGKIAGKTFVLTGAMSESRQYVSSYIAANGGYTRSAVSKNVDFIVVGSKPGSKLAKANSLGIPVITEQQLRSMT